MAGTPSLPLTVTWLAAGLWAMPLSTGVSLAPHLLSLLTSRVSLDKTSAGTPVPGGSKAVTGELGRHAGDGARGRREETKREERPKRGRGTKRGERYPPAEKNKIRQRKLETQRKRPETEERDLQEETNRDRMRTETRGGCLQCNECCLQTLEGVVSFTRRVWHSVPPHGRRRNRKLGVRISSFIPSFPSIRSHLFVCQSSVY